MSQGAKTGSWYCGIYCLNTYAHKRKCRVGWGEANWQGGGETGGRNEGRKKSRKKERVDRRHREMIEEMKLIQGNFFY